MKTYFVFIKNANLQPKKDKHIQHFIDYFIRYFFSSNFHYIFFLKQDEQSAIVCFYLGFFFSLKKLHFEIYIFFLIKKTQLNFLSYFSKKKMKTISTNMNLVLEETRYRQKRKKN